jgi:hypothetical protein
VSERHRRAILALLAPFAIAAALVLAPSALAAPCEDPETCGGGGDPTPTPTYLLTVDSPQGTITSSAAGISCPGDCSERYDEATPVTLTATRSGFAPQWTGCDSVPTASTCTVAMDADRTVAVGWQDVEDPQLSVFTPLRARNTIAVTASATDNAAVAKVRFAVGGVIVDATGPYAASFDVSSSTFADGSTVSVTAQAFDTNGRASAVSSRNVTIDKVAQLELSPLDAFTSAATVPMGFTTEAGATTTCALNGVSSGSCDTPYSPIDATTPDGTHVYSVTATDGVGNTVTQSRSFVLDRTAPVVALTGGPAEGSSGTSTSATFEFTVAEANLDAVTCRLDLVASAPCTAPVPVTGLGVGTHTMTITALDKAGHRHALTRSWTVTAPPTTTPDAGGPVPNPTKVAIKPQRTARWTKLKKVTITGLPAGAKVTVACKGGKKKGCPKPKTLAALRKAKLKPGAVVTIRIAKAGMETKVVTVTIRKGKAPKVA